MDQLLRSTDDEIKRSSKCLWKREKITTSSVNIDGIQTNISFTQNTQLSESDTIIIFIPGNPGAISFYNKFLEYLFDEYQVPIYGISHAGHDVARPGSPLMRRMHNELKRKIEDNNIQVHSLEQQISYKLQFMKQYVDSSKKIILIGHSLGCYVALKILEQFDHQDQIDKVILLFPVFERTMETTGGKVWVPLAQLLEKPTTSITEIMPDSAKNAIIRYVTSKRKCSLASTNSIISGVGSLISITGIKNMSKLASDLSKIGEIGGLSDVINTYQKKLTFYYGANDAWTPLSYYSQLKESFPTVDIRLDENNIEHAFVLHSSRAVAKIVAQIITEKDKNLSKDNDKRMFQLCRLKQYQTGLKSGD